MFPNESKFAKPHVKWSCNFSCATHEVKSILSLYGFKLDFTKTNPVYSECFNRIRTKGNIVLI